MAGIIVPIALLLMAILAALLAAPLFDKKAKDAEVRLTRGIAVAYVVIAGASTIYGFAETLMAQSLQVKMPVEEFWPTLPPGASVQGATAQVVSGGFTQALVEVQGLATGTRWLLGTTTLLQGIAAIFVGAAVISMCNGYIGKTTFRPVLVKWFTVTAAVIMVCGLGWQITESVAGMQASAQVLGFDGSTWKADVTEREDLHEIVGIPKAVYLEINLNFWPLWAGLGLFSTAQIFKRGLQMQKDTAGLI
ncbi:hypothetical protein ACFY5D_06935 [Paeniglutamicibacter sp. NPDC012692]|uniref:hypothetical protein n=1 Tax=Paeniglutamicibacter sp. NPDC012692 TaxID=3364388 RepID=UPI0036B189CB